MKGVLEKRLALVRCNPLLDKTYVELSGGVSCRAVEYDYDKIAKLDIEELKCEFFCDTPSVSITNVVIKKLPPSVLNPFSVYIVDVISSTKSVSSSSSRNAMHRCYYYNMRSCHGQQKSGVECLGVCKEIGTEICLQQLDPTGKHLQFLEICKNG